MALVFADLVQETTSTTGTGTLTLSGAVSGFQSFAAIGNTNTTYYRIKSGLDSEVGIGTYTLSGTTLSRDTVLYSSAGGTTKITVVTGATVSCVYPAERAVYLDAVGNLGIGGASAVNKLTVADTVLATGTGAGSLVNLSQTWNNAAGNPTAIKLNVTNTNSGSTSKLMDLQVGGSSTFGVDKTGKLLGPNDAFRISAWSTNSIILMQSTGNIVSLIFGETMQLARNYGISWSNANFDSNSPTDLRLDRDAANTLAQRNSTNAQTFRLYNTYTSVSDYSRLTFTTNANNHQITSEAAGSGALKPICEKFFSSASAPTTTNIPDGFSCMWKNTTDSTLKLYANDGGTLKSILLV
jgi:hypothetical protein